MLQIDKVLANAKRAVTLAVLLTAIGSGTALAQGAPPGSTSWKAAQGAPRGSTSWKTAQGAPPGSTSWKAAMKDQAVPVASNPTPFYG